jgi:hypothetical protein
VGNRLEISEESIMKNRALKIFLLVCTTLFSSCEKDHMGDCFKGSGDLTTQSREPGSFDGIHVEKKVDVILRYGSEQQVTVEAGSNLIDGITTEVKDNILYITNENKCNWVRSYSNPLVVAITLPSMHYIYQYGNGVISSDGTLPFDSLYMETWNSGDIKLALSSDLVEIRQHVSVGDVSLTGQARKLYVYNNGNGFSYLSAFECRQAQVDQRGTGDTQVRVDSILNYGISGIGNIYLYGPAAASGSIAGGGSLIRK